MTAPNPYETDVQSTDNAKAFAIGQSLSRVPWHLVQSVLLDDYYLAPIPGAVTAKQHGRLSRAAVMSIRARLEFNVHPKPDQNRPDLDAVIESIEKTISCESFYQSLVIADAECVGNDRDEACDARVHAHTELVDYWLTPLIEELQEAASDGFSHEQLVWMKLGRVLDEGQCRPDVVRFLSRPEGRDILRIDPYSAAQRKAENWLEEVVNKQKEEQPEEDSIDADDRKARPFEHLGGFASRQPGDLWPKSGWSDDVRRCWILAKIDVGHLVLLDELLSSKGSKEELAKGLKEKLAKALSNCVGQLSHAAYSVALGGARRLHVDLEKRLVELGPNVYPVDDQGATLLYALQQHVGKENKTPFNKIRDAHRDVFGPNEKLKDIKKGLPKELSDIIKSTRRSGTWLELDAASL